MSRFAADTSVSVERSRADIERALANYGATRFVYSTDTEKGLAIVGFAAKDRHVRFTLKLPKLDAFRYTETRRVRRSEADTRKAWEQAQRQRWRALLLVIKAKLEAVECNISTFEQEFLANIVLPDGSTVGDWAAPQLVAAYSTGHMPPLLGSGS